MGFLSAASVQFSMFCNKELLMWPLKTEANGPYQKPFDNAKYEMEFGTITQHVEAPGKKSNPVQQNYYNTQTS
jgi:hypothetical protein